MPADDDFATHRSYLFGVAYRMLGSRAEAEDAVQEAWARYLAARPEIERTRPYLATVVARVCLDVLRSARVRREAYVGSWLPEPLVTRLPATGTGADPAETAVREEQVSLALLVVLERLSPEQRLAFVLHDVFAVPFDAIAGALGTSTANARQLAARARRAVRSADASRRTPDLAEQRRVFTGFLAAAERGDLAELARALAPDVELVGDGGGLAPALRRPVVGVEQIARFLVGLFRHARRYPSRQELVLVNGDLGLLVEAQGQLVVIAPVIADGRIVALYHQLNPDKLRNVPRPTGQQRP